MIERERQTDRECVCRWLWTPEKRAMSLDLQGIVSCPV